MNPQIHLADITDNKELIKAHLIKKALYENNTLKVLDGILAIRNEDCFWDTYSNGKDIQRYLRKNIFSENVNNVLRAETLKSILDDILVDPRFEISEKQSERYLLFKNGRLDLENCSELNPVSDDDFHTYRIEANFKKDFLPTQGETLLKKISKSRFGKLLDEMFPNDTNSQLRLLELLGYLLAPITGQKKAVLFIGKPNTGKSLLLKILRLLLPASVVSHLDLSLIGRYNENAALLGAHVNITEDYDSNVVVDMSTLKLIIGNEVVTLTQKYQPSVSMPVKTKLILVGNALPKIKPTEINPFVERMLFLRFNNVPQQPNPKLIEELKNELDIIATVCTLAYIHALANGFTVSNSSDRWFKTQLCESQSEKLFIEDMIDGSAKEFFIPMADLKEAYSTYCQQNGLTENNVATLRRCIFDCFDNVIRERKNMSAHNLGNIHCLCGIQWKADALKGLRADLHSKALKIQKHYGAKDIHHDS